MRASQQGKCRTFDVRQSGGILLDRAVARLPESSGKAASFLFSVQDPTPAQIVGRLSAGCRVTRKRVPTGRPSKSPRSAWPFFRMSPASHLPTSDKMPEPGFGSGTPLRSFGTKLRGSASALPQLHPFVRSRELTPPTICAGDSGSPIHPRAARSTPIPLSSAVLRNAPFKGGSAADFDSGAHRSTADQDL